MKETLKEQIEWELSNLDSLKDYIFEELIVNSKNKEQINEAINSYAESFYRLKRLKDKDTKIIESNEEWIQVYTK